jgi:geranylgeranyl diphosphate synthase, type I
MSLKALSAAMLPAIEAELQKVVARLDHPETRDFHAMLTYHMGWSGEGAGAEAQGKRIRPLLVLLTTAASGGNWQSALPAAASIELIHNFSLVHDDIQDGSDLRRGRATVWKIWGMPQAINAGDALFILAHAALSDLKGEFPAETIQLAEILINDACLALSTGQYLDLSYEKRDDVSVEEYWPMVSGKTAALLSTCTQLGSLLGGADEAVQSSYRNFGQYLGLAFQVQDDFLGIWGDAALTGKSTESDLVTGKKSWPVLSGLTKKGRFAERWKKAPIQAEEVAEVSAMLAEEGVKLATQETTDQLTDLALDNLRAADPQGEAGEAIYELTRLLLDRQT